MAATATDWAAAAERAMIIVFMWVTVWNLILEGGKPRVARAGGWLHRRIKVFLSKGYTALGLMIPESNPDGSKAIPRASPKDALKITEIPGKHD
jgi:hypothetical protein